MNKNTKIQLALEIVTRLQNNGYKAYWVGGCVRDILMGSEPVDYDIVTSAKPDQVISLFDKTVPVGISYGVVKIIVKEIEFEVATFRSDGKYLDGRHPEKVHFSNEQEDANRRDFTINGIFYDPVKKNIFDYVGGEKDIKFGIIRTINEPVKRFSEDSLRLIRAVRFASRFLFKIEKNTYKAIEQMSTLINNISVERIREEIKKMLIGPNPDKAITLMEKTGLLEKILPEVCAMKGVSQPKNFHPEGDVWSHTILLLKKMKNPSFELAFSMLLHDIGKPPTFSIKERIRFDNHCRVGAKMAKNIGKRFHLSNKQIEHIVELVNYHLRFIDVRKMRESTLKRFLRLANFSDHLELHRIDCLASHGDLSNWDFCKKKLSNMKPDEIRPKPLLTGLDLIKIGYKPGPVFKKILINVEDAHMEKKIKTKEDAMAFIKHNYPIT